AASFRGRDDDGPLPPGPAGPPDWYAVEWFAPVEYRDVDSGELTTIEAPVTRFFTESSHAKPYQAARRWAQAMADRKRVAWLKEGWDGFPGFDGEQRFVRKS